MLVSKRRQQKLTKSSLPNAKECLPSNGQHKLEQVANASARRTLHRQLSAYHVGAHAVNTAVLMQLCLIWTLMLRTLTALHILSSLRCILVRTHTHTYTHTYTYIPRRMCLAFRRASVWSHVRWFCQMVCERSYRCNGAIPAPSRNSTLLGSVVGLCGVC